MMTIKTAYENTGTDLLGGERSETCYESTTVKQRNYHHVHAMIHDLTEEQPTFHIFRMLSAHNGNEDRKGKKCNVGAA